MRSSRLLAVLLALQRTGSSTAPDLAAEFEVSVRTIYRDVAELQMAGVPIYTTQGSGGGIHLIERWRSPIDGLTTPEARALVVGGGPAADLGLGSVLAIARSKLRSGLPATVRAELDLIDERFLLDTSSWFRPEASSKWLAVISEAVWTTSRIDIRYNRGGRTVARRLDPLGLVLKANIWYLIARHRGSTRTYRVSRITSVSPRGERFERPTNFELDRYWSEAAEAFDRDIRGTCTEILISTDCTAALQASVPGPLTATAIKSARIEPDGRLRIRLPVESIEVAADQLAGLPHVEVITPAGLRGRLKAHGDALVANNH